MKESTPSLLRAIGMISVFAVAIGSHFVARELAEIGRTRLTANIKFDLSKPFKSLSDEQKEARGYQVIINSMQDQINDLHYDMQNRNLMGAVNSSPFLIVLGFIGTVFIPCSFCAEWSVKRQKEKLAAVDEGNSKGVREIQKMSGCKYFN